MIKERDEDVLWDTVTLLKEQNHLENAKVLFRSLVERTFSLLKQPTDFLNDSIIDIPSEEMFHHFRFVDREIHRHLKIKDLQMANERLVDYIELLSEIVPDANKEQIRKRIMAELLTGHYREATQKEHVGTFTAEKTEVYTSSEAAEMIGVSDQTIRRWCEKGKYLEATKTDGGHWRIPRKYFKITLDEARKRKAFGEQLNEYNATQGEAEEMR